MKQIISIAISGVIALSAFAALAQSDDIGREAAKEEAKEAIMETPAVTSTAPTVLIVKDPSKLDEVLEALSATRKESEEKKYQPLVRSDASVFKVELSPVNETAVTNFVTYGVSEKTKALGAGERRAVMRDYFETVGRGNVNYEDVERITKGEKPVSRNLEKERGQVASVLKVFTKIFGHSPDFKDPKEDLAWNTLLYRIRFPRDLVKERAGIAEFKIIFKRAPTTPLDWSAVRVLGYVL